MESADIIFNERNITFLLLFLLKGKASDPGLAFSFSFLHGIIPDMNRRTQIQSFLGIALLLIASACGAGDSYNANVVGISDGDTIKVLHKGKQVKIRLYGIDTPERRQAFGKKAKQFTSQKVFRKTVQIIPMDTDRYGRTVALVQLPDESVTLNEAIVRNGFAWVYRKYCTADFCPNWLEYERKARSVGRGLWKDPDPIPPWEYRRR